MQNPTYESLKKKLEVRNKGLKERLVTKHKDAFDWVSNNTKQLAAGAMGSILLLSSPTVNLLPKPETNIENQKFVDIHDKSIVVSNLEQYLPTNVSELSVPQESKISELLSGYFGLTVKPEMHGLRLNTTYGYIGAEQHLMRYPGDTMDSHFDTTTSTGIDNLNKFGGSGMAPGRGAYGYFASSSKAMGKKEIDREKYYIAVQTFMSPGYSERIKEYVDFFKFRKMLVVNPDNGRAVVAVIGDAGPAVWTGKQLGGSPEVMSHLERVDGAQKGRVLYFFIDDPEDKIPLGPIEPNEIS